MKNIILLALLIVPSLMSAAFVGSPIKGATLTYLTEAGTTVKKGQILFKLLDRSQKVLIKRQNLQLKSALADLVDKKSDLKRSKKLIAKKAISLANHENTVVAYYKALLSYKRLKIKIEQSKIELKYYVGKAPYDCIVIRQIVCNNAGTDDGTKMLEIQPFDVKKDIPDNINKSSATMKLTASLSGKWFTYLPEEGQIVKKGGLLVKYDTSILELKVKLLETSLEEAEELLKDAKTDLERSIQLSKNKTISPTICEDAQYICTKGEIDVAILKLDIKETKNIIKEDFVFLAPYDLKVVKQVDSVGSGSNDGNTMLIVQKL